LASDIYRAIEELLKSGQRGALLTIFETTGSTPRKAGAKMLVREDGTVCGTIGGGCVEADLYADAQAVIKSQEIVVKEVDLTVKSLDELDMACGGKIKVLIEPVRAPEKLIIFGAGHVSHALYRVCRDLDFIITVTDDRSAFASKERFPDAELIVAPFEEQWEQVKVDANTYIAIVTRGHSGDEECLRGALRSRARFVGLIGSRTKLARFRRNLLDEGFSEKDMERIHCPIGLDIGAETPEEIAVSIAAQLVACRRGCEAASEAKFSKVKRTA